MRIYTTDSVVTALAKKAAMISVYSIHNPLHCYFEDGNVHADPMDMERMFNERWKAANGQQMYEYISAFLDEFERLDLQDRRSVYRMYRKKWDYLSRKWLTRIRKNSKPQTEGSGLLWHHYLGEDGHVYVKTDNDVVLLQF